MSKLRTLLETPVGPKRIVVTREVDGMVPVLDKDEKPVLGEDKKPKTKKGKVDEELAVLVGMPDATFLGLQTMEEGKKELRAMLWGIHLQERHVGENVGGFTAEDVFPVLLVTHYLEKVPGEDPMTEIEVAIYSKEHGLDFAKLYAAALQIVGNTDETQPVDPIVTVGLGN